MTNELEFPITQNKIQNGLAFAIEQHEIQKINKIRKHINLEPDYQRDYTLTNNNKIKSSYIQSIVDGISISLIQVNERENRAWDIIDGKQRLTTIFEFLDNKFKATIELSEKIFSKDIIEELLNGKFKPKGNKNEITFEYQDLSDDKPSHVILKNRINSYKLAFAVYQELSDDSVVQIFQAVNQGGIPLNKMEIRRAVYNGNLLRWIQKNLEEDIRLKTHRHFAGTKKARKIEEEYLLRCFILIHITKYSIDGELKTFPFQSNSLDSIMSQYKNIDLNNLDSDENKKFFTEINFNPKASFRDIMDFIYDYLYVDTNDKEFFYIDNHFICPKLAYPRKNTKINNATFDMFFGYFSQRDILVLKQKKDLVRQTIKDIFFEQSTVDDLLSKYSLKVNNYLKEGDVKWEELIKNHNFYECFMRLDTNDHTSYRMRMKIFRDILDSVIFKQKKRG